MLCVLVLLRVGSGLFDPSSRIRQSSVELLGDLLYRVTGTKAAGVADGDNEADADGDGFATGSTSALVLREC